MNENQVMESLSAVRKVIGYSKMGLNISPMVASNVVKRLDRVVSLQDMPQSRKILNEIATGAALPSEKRCEDSRREVAAFRGMVLSVKSQQELVETPVLQESSMEPSEHEETDRDAPAPGQ